MREYNLIWKEGTGLTSGIPTRFFVFNEEVNTPDEGEVMETDLFAFLEAPGEISIERHTIRENGVSQIVMTKMPKG